MMVEESIDNLIADLSSDDIERQATAIERAGVLTHHLAHLSVDALRRGPERYVVAERLAQLGSVVVAPLEELQTQTADAEVRTLSALVLLQLGSHRGVPWLLEVLEDHRYAYACATANGLARAGVRTARSAILTRLQECPVSEYDLIVCLLLALQQLEGNQPFAHFLPKGLYKRFTAPMLAWQIRSLFDAPLPIDAAHQPDQVGVR